MMGPLSAPMLCADVPVADLARLRRWRSDARCDAGPAVAHAGVEISWVNAGEVSFRMAGRHVAAAPGTVVVVPAGVEHVTSFSSAISAGALWIRAEAVDEIAEAFGRPALSRRLEPGAVECGSGIAALAEVLSAELTEAAPGHLLATEAILEAIIVRTLRTAPARGAPAGLRHPAIARALDLVHARYADPIGVADMARAAGTSRFHFSRLFRDDVGLSPYQYLVRVRLERAAELLRSGRRDVTAVAFDVGFGDLGRFARAFRQRFGCLPSAMARRGRRPSVGARDLACA